MPASSSCRSCSGIRATPFFDAHGVRLYLSRPTQPGYAGPATIYFQGDDVSGTVDRLVARGATVRELPEIAHRDSTYDLWLAFVGDPDGNNIGVMREAPKGLERGWLRSP